MPNRTITLLGQRHSFQANQKRTEVKAGRMGLRHQHAGKGSEQWR